MFISETIGYVYNLACVCIACIVRAREWVRRHRSRYIPRLSVL